jgi:hypothetical protein
VSEQNSCNWFCCLSLLNISFAFLQFFFFFPFEDFVEWDIGI